MDSTGIYCGRCVCRLGLVVVVLASLLLLLHINSAPVYQPISLTRPQALIANQSCDVNKLELREAIEESIMGLEQEDPALVSFVRRSQLLPPSLMPYNLSEPRRIDFSQFKQSVFANTTFFNGLNGGVFVEAGAFGGESLSNTLYFEKYRGWSGLLVEPDPQLYSSLVSLHRKAYSINAGLSFNTQAGTMNFKPNGYLGRMKTEKKKREGDVKVNVFPLYTILRALDVTLVDLFSLDIEGDEMKVLRTIPWGKIRFRLICIEINHVPGGTKGVIRYMESKGYLFLGMKVIDAWFGLRELLQETMDVDTYLKRNKVEQQRQKILK